MMTFLRDVMPYNGHRGHGRALGHGHGTGAPRDWSTSVHTANRRMRHGRAAWCMQLVDAL